MYYYIFISILHIFFIAPIIVAVYYYNQLDNKEQNKNIKKNLNGLILILVLLGLWGAIYHIISLYNLYNTFN